MLSGDCEIFLPFFVGTCKNLIKARIARELSVETKNIYNLIAFGPDVFIILCVSLFSKMLCLLYCNSLTAGPYHIWTRKVRYG